MSDSTAARLTATTQQTFVKRHPIRGILWGLMMGIGLTIVLIVTKVISLDLTMMILVTVIATAVGVLWSTLGPAKAPTGPPPASVTVSGAAPPPSRFDDFGETPTDRPEHLVTEEPPADPSERADGD